MASVNLPNTEGMTSLDELKNAIGKMTKELTWLLQNLDTRNINYVDGDLLVNGTVTALKMQVEELSAITANLGHIIAGVLESVEIYGSLISTNRYGYPKVEINNTQNMIGAFDANGVRRVGIGHNGQRIGFAGIEFWGSNGALKGGLYGDSSYFGLLAENNLQILSFGGVTSFAGDVDFTSASVSGLSINKVNGLQSALNDIWDAIDSL